MSGYVDAPSQSPDGPIRHVLFDFIIVGEGEGVVCKLQLCKSVGVVTAVAHQRWGSELSPTNITKDQDQPKIKFFAPRQLFLKLLIVLS